MSENLAAVNHNAFDPAAGPLGFVTRAARDGAADARAAADRTWEATHRFACRFVYTTTYTVSYGVVFTSALLARSVPRDNAAVRGLIDGARAAVEKVDHLRDAAPEEPAPAPSPA